MKVAALYVDPRGPYFGRDDVDPWDESRDARLYAGPWPVVAHPPCSRWCQLASVNHARWGTPIGEDGGCFAAALDHVRQYGGVLEHPAYSIAWRAFDLPVPERGRWRRSLLDEGWVAEVSQAAYGHAARKRTWLYYVGETTPIELDWREPEVTGAVGAGINSGECLDRRRLSRAEAIHTPPAFAATLIGLARHASSSPRSTPASSDPNTGRDRSLASQQKVDRPCMGRRGTVLTGAAA